MQQDDLDAWGPYLDALLTIDHRAPRDTDPDLTGYDRIVVNNSGGKDSMAALIVTVRRAAAAGVLDRVVVQYNDLGRVVWPSTREADEELAAAGFKPWLVDRFGDRPGCRDLAEQHARHFGLRFEVRSRAGGDLLDEVERRGKFPDAARRWCTSDRGTRAWVVDRAEPTDRVEEVYCAVVPGAGAFALTEDLMTGNCVLASKKDLLTAIPLRPGLAREYARVEAETGHSFQQARTMASLIAEAGVAR